MRDVNPQLISQVIDLHDFVRKSAVERCLANATGCHAGRVATLYGFAVGVDEVAGGHIVGLQVLVMKAGPLAELVIPGLEGSGGSRVLHDVLDPARISCIFSSSLSVNALATSSVN